MAQARTLRASGRARAIDILTEPASPQSARRQSLKPLGLVPIDAASLASLRRAARPLVEPREARDRLAAPTAGSGVLHLLVLLALLVVLPKPQGGHAPEPSSVQMLFPQTGSSGMTGAEAPTPQTGGGTPARQPASSPPPTVTLPPDVAPAPEPLPEPAPPEASPTPAPTPTAPPVPKPETPTPVARPRASTRTMRLRTSRPTEARRSSNPFDAPMNLTFASPDEEGPPAARARHGSHGAVDLSLGPIAHNGEMRIPYARTGIKGVSPDYDAELQDWIQRHLYYPEEAARKGQDGTAEVHVVLDRDGQVRDVELTTSSGADLLDDATSGMFRGATLPPVPPDMAGGHFDIDLTVHYILMHGP